MRETSMDVSQIIQSYQSVQENKGSQYKFYAVEVYEEGDISKANMKLTDADLDAWEEENELDATKNLEKQTDRFLTFSYMLSDDFAEFKSAISSGKLFIHESEEGVIGVGKIGDKMKIEHAVYEKFITSM